MTHAAITLPVCQDDSSGRFEACLQDAGVDALRASAPTTLQVNLGKRCNQACHHCHVDAGPNRTEEMTEETLDAVIAALGRHRFSTLDITGGAPEIHRGFRRLAEYGRSVCERVIDRSNLTIFFEPGHEDLPEFLAGLGIEVTASLPCYEADNVDRQRGQGVFDKSIRALRRLNRLGYGQRDSGLIVNLVYNPIGASLPPAQQSLEAAYKEQLAERFGIVFNQLFTITNMPINRFEHDLQRTGQLGPYMQTLQRAFNPATIDHLMCRDLISVSWQGELYDCDFNQMLELPVEAGAPQHIRDFDPQQLARRRIRTADHCLGCTAGHGSSCGGAVV